MKRILAIGIILLFIGMSISSSTGFNFVEQSNTAISNGKTLYVGGSGPGNYTKIQDAIDDASNGYTVFVYNGTYYESIIVYKSINLIGENKYTTKIYTYYDGYVVNISADGTKLCCFSIINENDGALLIKSSFNNITNNIIEGTEEPGIALKSYNKKNIISKNLFKRNGYISIRISESCTNTIIKNNYFVDNLHDIVIKNNCHNTTIIGNSIIGTWCCAVIDILGSDNNTIKNNYIYPSWYFGISLCLSDYNSIIGNIISNGSGVIFKHSNHNYFINNTIFDCDRIILENSSYNILQCNNITKCIKTGIFINKESRKNIIYHNNFLRNSENAYDNGDNIWNDSYPSGGNYWDDYTGNDSDGDGIGDIPYNISGGDNQDRYPLMKPIGNDTNPPSTTISFNPPYPNGDNGWYISNVKVRLKAKDEGIGVKSIYYRINGGEWKNHSGDVVNFVIDYDCWIDGSIEFYAVDYSGNKEEINFVGDIYIDQLPPEIEVIIEAHRENLRWIVKFTITAEDSCSCLDRVEFFINDGHQETIIDPGPEYEFIIQWHKSLKNCVFYFYCYDRAGNVAIASVNGSNIESYPDSQSYNIFFSKWLERFPLLNRLIMRIMERWSI